jgi:hypothetical protein
MVNKTGKDFDPSSDIPSLAGKVILITGGTHDFAYSTSPWPTGRRALCKNGESQDYFRSNWRVLDNEYYL